MTTISVITRWSDGEARFANRFLYNWECADEIVVVDGGSKDNSKELLLEDPRVKWSEFTEKVKGKRGGWRNPEGKHLNKCIETATGDWIVLAEADMWPSISLGHILRPLLETTEADLVASVFYHISTDKQCYYPSISGQVYTAWRREIGEKKGIRCDDKQDFHPKLKIKPLCNNMVRIPQNFFNRIHMTFDDNDWVERKRKFYKEVHAWPGVDYREKWAQRILPDHMMWYGDHHIMNGDMGKIEQVKLKAMELLNKGFDKKIKYAWK